jgi:hypothetical protein
MIALLAGTLGVFGCDDDPQTGNGGTGGSGTAGTGGSGTAGTGGSGTAGTGGSGGSGGTGGGGGSVDDPCTGGECENDQARKDACGIGIEYCNSLGAGGAGGAPTEQQCDAVGTAICNVDTGAGGSGGDGGAGGNPGDCDWTALEICAVCEITGGIEDCEEEFAACLLGDLSGNECEKCAAAALLDCIE